MKKGFRTAILLVTCVTCIFNYSADARNPKLDRTSTADRLTTLAASDRRVIERAVHTRGRMQLVVRNNGTFGSEGEPVLDPITGSYVQACIYPKNSDLIYLWVCALWVGAVVGRDTIVSTGAEDLYCSYEMWPDIPPFGEMKFETIDPTSPNYSEDAYSEEDIICYYTDTSTNPALVNSDYCDDPTPHVPLNIKATQRSMAWSYDYADDFILFDYKVENIGNETLEDVYMGIWLDGCVFHQSLQDIEYWTDDIVGFYRTHPSADGCGFIDTINIAYHADNDGEPVDGRWTEKSPLSVVGVRVVRTPSDSLNYSFNWWIMNWTDVTRDFGPRLRGTPEDPFRDFGVRMGTPAGDHNKYYVMRHKEFDYDLMYTAVDHTAEGFLPPPEYAETYAKGFDVRYIMSFGPFTIDPGEKLPISLAWVGGENFHVNPNDFDSFDPYHPSIFYNKLDFSSLATNSRWASWIYDNPGVDTDGDGDSGKHHVCCSDTTVTDTGLVFGICDTTWYEGDGVPDFRGASPPPAPEFWVEPQLGSLRIRFNGLRSETEADRFSGLVDFEGYRVYIGRDDRLQSYSIIASYDRENFSKYVYDHARLAWSVSDLPFTRSELQALYGDPAGIENFNPTSYSAVNPYFHPYYRDSVFYFVTQDFNRAEFGVTTPIRRIYPDQPYPSTLNADDAQPEELTEDGYLKYFEYEFIIEDLLPTVPYYINVTAFDFGSPEIGLSALETSVLNGAQVAYPLTSVEEVEENDLKVYVYPNPYRIDADYDGLGYENRHGILSEDRMRRLHFANLPPVCKIYIYSLDGDLVREIGHNYPEGGPEAMHDTWDLITRNTQAAVTGLYYWVVESEQGTQMGKFVIIK
ncbi:MAG: hypothetical protein AB1483_07865 [Candidatus Zixiibacteriota bacterium]